ncbi:MAG TPA: hypothetical protein VF026_31005, partial [Ktedonobacteraceae bacterium]
MPRSSSDQAKPISGYFGGLLARAGEQVSFLARGTQLAALIGINLRISSSYSVGARVDEGRWGGPLWSPASCSPGSQLG